jgi:hypothetical protein
MINIREWLFLDAEKLPPQPILTINTIRRECLIELTDADLTLAEVNAPEDVVPSSQPRETK